MQSQKTSIRHLRTIQNGRNFAPVGTSSSSVLSASNGARLDRRPPAVAQEPAAENYLSSRTFAGAENDFVPHKRESRADCRLIGSDADRDESNARVCFDCPTLFDSVMNFMNRYYSRRQ